jgi:hypothetical protein
MHALHGARPRALSRLLETAFAVTVLPTYLLDQHADISAGSPVGGAAPWNDRLPRKSNR